MKWDGLWCPCCKYKLRSKPKNKKYREKFQARIQKQEGIINVV